MVLSWIAHRIDRAVDSTPAPLRWLERCDAEVLGAYRAARRSLFTWQLPAMGAVVTVVWLIKSVQGLPPGHPVFIVGGLLALLLVVWPLPLARLAVVAWRRAPTAPVFGGRLRVLAGAIWATLAVAVTGLATLAAFFGYGMLR